MIFDEYFKKLKGLWSNGYGLALEEEYFLVQIEQETFKLELLCFQDLLH